MARPVGRAWKVAIVSVCLAYQALVYIVLADGYGGSARFALAVIPLVALGIWVSIRARQKLAWTLAICAAALAIYALEQRGGNALPAMNALTHGAINICMLWLFGRSLAAGREPLVTRFARRIHGKLPPEIEAYTRHVTVAWGVFFVTQILASAALWVLAPIQTWSFFINVLSLPLVALMFAVEYVYRVCRFRDHKHVSPIEGVQAFMDASHTPAAPPAMDAGIARDGHA
jgi:uncharacterized membrane protein